MRVTDHGFVQIRNLSVTIIIYKDYVAWLRGCQNTIALGTSLVNLLLILENTCCLVAIEIPNRIVYLRTIHLCRGLTQDIGFTMNDTFGVGNAQYLIFVECAVDSYSVSEFTGIVIPI